MPSDRLGLGLNQAPYLFAVIGDLGQTNNSAANIQQIRSNTPNRPGTAMLIGDLSYADASWTARVDPTTNLTEGACNATRWDSWGRMVEPLAANVPLMTLPGRWSSFWRRLAGGLVAFVALCLFFGRTFSAVFTRSPAPSPPPDCLLSPLRCRCAGVLCVLGGAACTVLVGWLSAPPTPRVPTAASDRHLIAI